MTIRKEISILENLFHDSQRVDEKDMSLEQSKNDQLVSSIVNNHFGSGILLSSPMQKVLFDSDELNSAQASLLPNFFDGTGMLPTEQPSDINLGNQLEVELTESNVYGRFSVRVAIIGLDFDGNIQMDRMYFHKNGKQVTSKHYKKILSIFFNDFKGNNNYSRNHGGRIVIKEAASFQLSLDPVMISQDVEPDIFWRDFKTCFVVSSSPEPLTDAIQNGIGSQYSVDGLNINLTGHTSKSLAPNDVVYQIGQKFKATTNNIQKVTLLLGAVLDSGQPESSQFDWAGDLVISIYPLQTTVNSQSDLLPNLAIDFDPSNTPLAQLSYSQATLKSYGYVLTDVLQPVDFVFNSTKIGNAGSIEIDKYYAITVRRSGAAISGTLSVGVGGDRTSNSRSIVYNGTWVDVTDEDLWFQVWTDATKISDGQAYDAGVGISIGKTTTDTETGATIDYQKRYQSFVSTGENTLNTAIVQATEVGSVVAQDERNGNSLFTRKQYSPILSFLSDADLASIKNVSEPLVVGCAKDTNPKINSTIDIRQIIPGLVGTDTFCIVNPDADLLSLNLVGSVLIPNILSAGNAYRIVKAVLCTDGYGDVNGDGIIDASDVQRASEMASLGYDLTSLPTHTAIINGDVTILEILRANVKGIAGTTSVTASDVNLITSYVNKSINAFPVGSTFTRLCLTVQNLTGRNDSYHDCGDGLVRLDGSQGTNIVSTSLLSADQLMYYGYAGTPDMKSADSIFTTSPLDRFDYRIVPYPEWQDYMVLLSSNTRKVPASFTSTEAVTTTCDTQQSTLCNDKNSSTLAADPGRNDIYVPDHLMIDKGQIIRPNGDYFKVDIEIGTVTLELPISSLTEASVNIFDKFVSDRGDGLTNGGYKAMKYADCSTVQDLDLALNKVKFSVSIQSYYPNLDGYGLYDGYIVPDESLLAVNIDPTTGILKISTQGLDVDLVYDTLISKIQVQVFLKKAGWNNVPIVVSPSELQGLIS